MNLASPTAGGDRSASGSGVHAGSPEAEDDRSDERGAVMVMVALLFVILVVIAATVIDLAATRSDRSVNQVAADSAATAGAGVVRDIGGQGACGVAVGYLEELAGQPIPGLDCTGFPTTCNLTTTPALTTTTFGSQTISLTHPVLDSDPLMNPGAVGAAGQTVHPLDGEPCDRFGVQINDVHTTVFARIIGSATVQSSIHSVALAGAHFDTGRAINLLLLERHDCQVLQVQGGGGGQGGIIVQAVIDDINGQTLPGRINVDSDASGGCSSKGVISAGGTGAVIRADGLPGCPGETSDGPGAGCGTMEVLAPGPPGCLMPACNSTGLVAPSPEQTFERLTRAMIDWRYNCKSPYPAALDIDRCPNSAVRPAYIDSLVADVGSSGVPTGFQSYTAAGYPCWITGPTTVPVGNWVVDCSDLKVSDVLKFQGGNLIFDGDITLQGPSTLSINTSNSHSFSWVENSPLDITDHSGQATFVYLRDGVVSKGSQAHLDMDQVMVYVTSTSLLDVGGGSGSLRWIAPTTGPFDDLALWSETAAEHKFGGGSSLELEGVLFAPYGDFTYSGNGTQQQVAAQFISLTLSTNGGGLLAIQPRSSRSVLFPSITATLIR